MEQERWVIDRFEEDTAILESPSRKTIVLPRYHLPADATEGCHLWFDGERYHRDAAATEEARTRIQSKFERLRKKK